jgi:hypothetical protein
MDIQNNVYLTQPDNRDDLVRRSVAVCEQIPPHILLNAAMGVSGSVPADYPIPPFRGQRASRFAIYVGGGKPIGLAGALPRERTLSGNVYTLTGR